MSYTYSADDGTPLTRCPHCNADLTAEGGITLGLSIGGAVVERGTRLDNGLLVDTEDGAVAAGFHSYTECGGCGEMLDEDW